MNNLALIWRMALQDMRGGYRHLRLFFACLTLGVAVIACIGSLMSAVREGIHHEAKSLVGGDVEIRQLYRPIGKLPQAYMQFQGSLSRSMDMRSMAEAKERRQLVELKSIDDRYPLYGEWVTEPQLSREELFGKIGNTYGAAVEEGLLPALGLKIGDRFKIGEQKFEIRAVIRNEPDRGLSFFSLGLRVMVSPDGFYATKLIQPGSMVNFRYRVKLPDQTDMDDWRSALKTRFPNASKWNMRDHREAAPMFTSLFDRLSLFFSLTGLTTLITAGIGISNAAGAYLWTKRETIAAMKTLGASTRRIYAIYLLQLLLAALPAIAFGLVIGVSAQGMLVGSLNEFLPVHSVSGIYAKPLLIVAAFGIATVALFSLIPLAQAARTRPATLFRTQGGTDSDTFRLLSGRAGIPLIIVMAILIALLTLLAVLFTETVKIPLYFAVGVSIAIGLYAFIGKALQHFSLVHARKGNKPLSMIMAMTNLARIGSPTVSIVIALGIGMSLVVALALAGGNLKRQIEAELPDKAPAFYMIDVQPSQVEELKETLSHIQGVGAIQETPMIRGVITKIKDEPVNVDSISPDARWAVRGDRGITWAAKPPPNVQLTAGEWWPENYDGPPLVSFDAQLARGMGLKLGDTITISSMGKDIIATIASLRSINWGTLEMNFATILSPGAVKDLPVMYLATVMASKDAEWPVQAKLAEEFGNVSVVRVRDALAKIAALLENVSNAVLITASLTILCGILVMASALNASLQRRIYDTVMLKVLGVTKRIILRIYLFEFMLMGLSVTFVSLIVGTCVAYGILQLMIFSEFQLLPGVIAIALAATLVSSVVLGLISTRAALKVKPLAYLRNE